MKNTERSQRRVIAKRRRGSLYPMVMGMSAIIACLAVAGLEMSRVASKANQGLREQLEARRMAQAGLEFWQRQYNAGAISDPSATLQQTFTTQSGFSVSATYSSAGANPNGAAQVTSVGRFGNATQSLTARYDSRPTLYDGFRCALYSNTASIEHSNSTVSANHWSISKTFTSATGTSVINMDAMAGTTFTGVNTTSNLKQRQINPIPWNMPTASFLNTSPTYPGNYYLSAPAQGVTIQPPKGNEELLLNPSLNTNLSSWYCNNSNAQLTLETGRTLKGGKISNRSAGTDSPIQDITRFVIKDRSYQLSVWIKPDVAGKFRFRITVYSGNPSTPSVTTSEWASLNAGNFSQFTTSSLSCTWSSLPTKVEIGIESDKSQTYIFDDFSMKDTTRAATVAYIQNTVLSDTFNPFSVNNVQPAISGIYIVDGRSSRIRIDNCRIRSTLVFTNCPTVELGGGIVWEVPGKNYPAIIVNGTIEDKTDTQLLTEASTGCNYNPSHTPRGSNSDSDLLDFYTCTIRGPIFATGTISLGNTDTNLGKIRLFTGPIFAGGALSIQNTTKDIQFPSDMILNPPPGFYPSSTPMRLIPSSIRETSASGGTGPQGITISAG